MNINNELSEDPRPTQGSWAPGKYYCLCQVCGNRFVGDKRSMSCAPCAYGDEKCHAGKDGDCVHAGCPQLRIGDRFRNHPNPRRTKRERSNTDAYLVSFMLGAPLRCGRVRYQTTPYPRLPRVWHVLASGCGSNCGREVSAGVQKCHDPVNEKHSTMIVIADRIHIAHFAGKESSKRRSMFGVIPV